MNDTTPLTLKEINLGNTEFPPELNVSHHRKNQFCTYYILYRNLIAGKDFFKKVFLEF
jgi:hypothetical protein